MQSIPQSEQARAARAAVESAMDASGWPWNRRVSLWIDLLVLVEERAE